MALTLIEAAKLETGDSFRSGVIELYAGSSSILANLPFNSIAGNALKYNREASLPGVGFRGVNEAYTPSSGVLNPIVEALVIAGGDLDVDKFIIDTMGENIRSTHESMKIRALGLQWTQKFVKGDTSSDPREFDGLQVRVVGSQLIAAGSTANGTPLSLSVAFIDEAGKVVSISEMAPHTEDSHCAARPARFALEMSKGWFAGKGIRAGAKLQGLDKASPPQ